jgi:hypothetical protein
MKKFFWIIIIGAILFFGYQNHVVLAEKARSILASSPCDTPITYRIGTIDPRFNTTKDTLITDTQQATHLWTTAAGKKLFEYDPQSAFTVNLVYDERQSLNTQINNLDEQLQTKDQTLKPEIAAYEKKVADFNSRVTNLNKQVEEWNQKGGAPAEDYEKLKQEQASLQQEAQELESLAQSLGQSTDQYNTQVQQLGQTVETFNQTLSAKPEEGLYIEKNNERKIIIYFNTSHQELIHTLAHEFGHALKLEHVPTPNSIMYAQTNNTIVLSTDDIAELKAVCKERSIVDKFADALAIVTAQIQVTLAKQRN